MPHKYKSKPGTIGRSIEKLVLKCKANPMQFYILEAALGQASGLPDARVTINGMSPIETPGYKAAQAEVDEILRRCGIDPNAGLHPAKS